MFKGQQSPEYGRFLFGGGVLDPWRWERRIVPKRL